MLAGEGWEGEEEGQAIRGTLGLGWATSDLIHHMLCRHKLREQFVYMISLICLSFPYTSPFISTSHPHPHPTLLTLHPTLPIFHPHSHPSLHITFHPILSICHANPSPLSSLPPLTHLFLPSSLTPIPHPSTPLFLPPSLPSPEKEVVL